MSDQAQFIDTHDTYHKKLQKKYPIQSIQQKIASKIDATQHFFGWEAILSSWKLWWIRWIYNHSDEYAKWLSFCETSPKLGAG